MLCLLQYKSVAFIWNDRVSQVLQEKAGLVECMIYEVAKLIITLV